MNMFAEGARITGDFDFDFDLLPEPLFSRSPPSSHRGTRRHSVSASVDTMRRGSFRAGRGTLEAVPEVVETPRSSTQRPSQSAMPPVPRPDQDVRRLSLPVLATNPNLQPRPSRSSMMEYAKATEDVNDMMRFDDEAGEDEIVPGGLVRGSSVGGYPKRHSSVLRRMNTGRRQRESTLYSSGSNQAVEEDNHGRITEMMEGLGIGAERSGGGRFKKVTIDSE